MAISLSNFLYPLLLLLIPASHADTVTYDMNVGWTTANPDGQHERRVIGINGHWPPPLLNITKGDRVIVNLHNQVGLAYMFNCGLRLTLDSLVTKARVSISTACTRMVQLIWTDRLARLSAIFQLGIR